MYNSQHLKVSLKLRRNPEHVVEKYNTNAISKKTWMGTVRKEHKKKIAPVNNTLMVIYNLNMHTLKSTTQRSL
jgi:hypothetical protein